MVLRPTRHVIGFRRPGLTALVHIFGTVDVVNIIQRPTRPESPEI